MGRIGKVCFPLRRSPPGFCPSFIFNVVNNIELSRVKIRFANTNALFRIGLK